MLRIQRTRKRRVVLAIIGQLGAANLNELCRLIDAEPADDTLILDLTDLVLADRAAVQVLRQYEARGRVVLRNSPAYVRTWIVAEADDQH
jgi:hypothetical protein